MHTDILKELHIMNSKESELNYYKKLLDLVFQKSKSIMEDKIQTEMSRLKKVSLKSYVYNGFIIISFMS